MKILTLDQIKSALPSVDLMAEIEEGFVAYSQGRAVVPPVGELVLRDPPGDVHIKYGYISGDDYYVIKIASGFYENHKLELPTGDGLMLVFSQKTGQLEAILIDEAYLTDIRTAVGGAIAAKYLAPSNVERIGIVGTGTQARLQLEYLAPVTSCRDVLTWGRSENKLDTYQQDMSTQGFNIETTTDAGDIMASCNLIVTTTPATEPILTGQVQPGTHISAIGSDTHDKQELDAEILRQADLVVADSGNEDRRDRRIRSGRTRQYHCRRRAWQGIGRADHDRRFNGRRRAGYSDQQSGFVKRIIDRPPRSRDGRSSASFVAQCQHWPRRRRATGLQGNRQPGHSQRR
jgi:ornithine cyclodeaminase